MELPESANGCHATELMDLLALYHTGQGCGVYALQSRGGEGPTEDELADVQYLLDDILSGKYGASDISDMATAYDWLPVIKKMLEV